MIVGNNNFTGGFSLKQVKLKTGFKDLEQDIMYSTHGLIL